MTHRARTLVVPLLLGLFLLQAVTAVRSKSATWDETNYFGMGDYLLRNGRWDVPSSVIHPPLAFYLDSVPVLFADVDRTVWRRAADTAGCGQGPAGGSPGGEPCGSLGFLGAADSERGRTLLASEANADDRLLLASRVMTVLQALLLGFFVYRLAAAMYGWSGGVLALTFFAFCPNMLAHGSLITPDMTLTVFFFLAVCALREALVGRRPGSFVLAGLTLGLALLSKFTALLLLPIEAVIVGVCLLSARGAPRPPAAHPALRPPPFKWLGVAAGCAALVFLAGYRFNPSPYLQGLAVQGGHGAHSAFLMGAISADGWWYYCVTAFALKTPIPLQIFLGVALVGLCARLARGVARVGLDDVVLWLPVIALFVFFSIELRSIGVRYLLPAYPFLFVIAAGAVVSLERGMARGWRPKSLLAIPLAWYVVGTLAVWPDHLAYFNESIGGPRNGYRYLVDSNLDWGQDLKGLKAFMDRRGIDSIYLSYFGLDAPDRYGIRYVWLPSYELRNPNPQATVNIPRGSYVAISVTNLQGVYMTPPSMFRWLDRYTPIATIGHSIFVYRLD